MEKIVIVVGDRHHPHAHHRKLTGTVRVGRALSCDIIISDSHAEPLQLIFHEADDKRSVEVLGSINPVWRNGEVAPPGIYDFVSGDEWSFGRTHLQVFNESHAVAPVEKLVMQEYRGNGLNQAALLLLTLLILIVVIVLNDWLATYEPFEWDNEASVLMPLLIMIFSWAALWAVVGRFITGKSQFGVHFAASAMFMVVLILNDAFVQYMSYGLNMDLFWDLALCISDALFFSVLLYIHFAYAATIKNMKAIQLALGACFGVFLYFADYDQAARLKPHFNQSVKPPFAILVKPETVPEFMQRINQGFVDVSDEASESSR